MKNFFSLKFITITILVIIFLSASFQGTENTTTTNKASSLSSTVKIGFLYPATGALGSLGQGFMDGAVAAAYRINMTYGKFFNVTIDAKDTATDPMTAKTAAQTLVTNGVQVIVGAAASGATLAASEVTIPNSIPLISYASTNPSISNLNDSDYVFRTVASDSYQGVDLANLTYNSGNTTAYILNLNNAYGNAVASKFKLAYQALGGTVVGQTAYDPASTSFSTEVSNIKSSGADAVVMVSYPTDANAIFTEAKTQGLPGPFFGTDGIASTLVTNNTATRDYLNGKLFGTTPLTGANASGTIYPQFLSDLSATGGSFGIYGDYVYDSFLLAGAAINKTQNYNGLAIRDALYAVANGFIGATNPNKAFDCDGDPIAQIYDYWNASNYNVTLMQGSAINFDALGSPSTTACGLHPYVSTTTTTSTATSTSTTTTSTTTPTATATTSTTSASTTTTPTTTTTTNTTNTTTNTTSNTSPTNSTATSSSSKTTSEVISATKTITSSPGFEIFSFTVGFATILFFVRRKRR